VGLRELLVLGALGFAVVSGANDGAAVLATGLRVRGIPPWVGVLAIAAGVAVVPLVLGTSVASTLANRLVAFDGNRGQVALFAAVGTAVAVTTVLARWGLPTSLTLALVGAITGAGLGGGFEVSWTTVAFVLLMGVVAPIVGVVSGSLLTIALAAVPLGSPVHTRTTRWHRGAFSLQCVAYGANDGQKMLAVLAVALGGGGQRVDIAVPWLLALAGLFAVGTVVGLPRVAETLGGGLVALQPPAAVVTELSSAGVVLATSLVGAPVSMTQAISGAMVGTGITRGRGRIRWQEAAAVAGAWVVTLPAALAVAMLTTAIATRGSA